MGNRFATCAASRSAAWLGSTISATSRSPRFWDGHHHCVTGREGGQQRLVDRVPGETALSMSGGSMRFTASTTELLSGATHRVPPVMPTHGQNQTAAPGRGLPFRQEQRPSVLARPRRMDNRRRPPGGDAGSRARVRGDRRAASAARARSRWPISTLSAASPSSTRSPRPSCSSPRRRELHDRRRRRDLRRPGRTPPPDAPASARAVTVEEGVNAGNDRGVGAGRVQRRGSGRPDGGLGRDERDEVQRRAVDVVGSQLAPVAEALEPVGEEPLDAQWTLLVPVGDKIAGHVLDVGADLPDEREVTRFPGVTPCLDEPIDAAGAEDRPVRLSTG